MCFIYLIDWGSFPFFLGLVECSRGLGHAHSTAPIYLLRSYNVERTGIAPSGVGGKHSISSWQQHHYVWQYLYEGQR